MHMNKGLIILTAQKSNDSLGDVTHYPNYIFYISVTQLPSELMNRISKPVEQRILQEIKSIQALDTAHSLLSQSPATIVKVEAAIKEGYATKSVEGYAVVGYKQAVNQPVKSAAAFAG